MTTGMGQAGHGWLFGAVVELFAELHDVDLSLTEGGADGGSRGGFAGHDLELDISVDLFGCHCGISSTLLAGLCRRELGTAEWVRETL